MDILLHTGHLPGPLPVNQSLENLNFLPQTGSMDTILRIAPGKIGQELPLTADSLPKLSIWAARVGMAVTVQSETGHYYRARLLTDSGMVRLFEQFSHSPEPPQWRRLCQAIPDKERMNWIIQKAVELGATEIQPILTERANSGPIHGPRQDKSATWARIARQAAIQCRRARLPAVQPPISLKIILEQASFPHQRTIALDLGNECPPLWSIAAPCSQSPLTLLVGPEGGWSPTEQHSLELAAICRVSLGVRVLRTETAALAALTILAAVDNAFT